MPETPVLAYVGLGSNLDGPARQIACALSRLRQWPGVHALRASRLYCTPPWGRPGQPDFVNAVAEICFEGPAQALLTGLLAIERESGRIRDGSRWGPRRLDLDLLLFDHHRIDSVELSVPHPHMAERAFVLLPLAELAPAWPLSDGRSVQEHAAIVDVAGITALAG